MKKTIFRNIAILSAIFIVAFSTMLITNYFQVKGSDLLQTEVIETLKKLNDENANNPKLQEQIRELDLLARRAYFIRLDHLKTGAYILIAMLAVFVISVRLLFAHDKQVPDKQIDPIDDWAVKTLARKYVAWIAGGITAVALAFVVLTSPHLKPAPAKEPAGQLAATTPEPEEPENIPEEESAGKQLPEEEIKTEAEAKENRDTVPVSKENTEKESVPEKPEVPKTTFNNFRGNYSTGVTTAKQIPVKWNVSSGENIAWSSKVPKKGYNSPVITGNKVFITGADAESRELYCFDLNTGELAWTFKAENIPGSPAQVPKTTDDTGLAASSVATNGKQVCAVFASGDLICSDLEGKQLWAKNIGVPVNHYGYASSLLAFGSTLIIQYDNTNASKVMALDMATGKELWSKNRADKIGWGSPIIAYHNGKPQLILMSNPGITSYNPANGEQNWRVECMSGEVGASPCYADGVVYGANEYASLTAIDAATGNTLWQVNDYLPEVSSPVATKENIYVATSYGVVAGYNAKTGELRCSHELNDEFYSSPVIAENRLYLFSNNGKMYLFSADNEFKLLDSFETGEKTFATPAFTDGKIVVRTENSIYCAVNKSNKK